MCEYLVLWKAPDGISATPIPENLYKELEELDIGEATKHFHRFRVGDYLEFTRSGEFNGTFGVPKKWPFNNKKWKGVICL